MPNKSVSSCFLKVVACFQWRCCCAIISVLTMEMNHHIEVRNLYLDWNPLEVQLGEIPRSEVRAALF